MCICICVYICIDVSTYIQIYDRLAGEHFLVDHEVVAAHAVAVARHDVARREQHNVAHHNLCFSLEI